MSAICFCVSFVVVELDDHWERFGERAMDAARSRCLQETTRGRESVSEVFVPGKVDLLQMILRSSSSSGTTCVRPLEEQSHLCIS